MKKYVCLTERDHLEKAEYFIKLACNAEGVQAKTVNHSFDAETGYNLWLINFAKEPDKSNLLKLAANFRDSPFDFGAMIFDPKHPGEDCFVLGLRIEKN